MPGTRTLSCSGVKQALCLRSNVPLNDAPARDQFLSFRVAQSLPADMPIGSKWPSSHSLLNSNLGSNGCNPFTEPEVVTVT